MLDAGLRHRPFPDDTASLLPGPLTATRTGLTPASDDELANQTSTIYMINLQLSGRTKGYRYPIEVIGQAVWLYHRFALSLRDVEELMLARGVVVSYETIRSWCAKFGPDYAARLRRWRPRSGRGGPPQFPPPSSERSAPSTPGETLVAAPPRSSPLPWPSPFLAGLGTPSPHPQAGRPVNDAAGFT